MIQLAKNTQVRFVNYVKKVNFRVFILITFVLLSACYVSPEITASEFTGIWKATDYDKLLKSNIPTIVMLEFDEDKVNIYLNQLNQAFNIPFILDDDIFLFDGEFFPPSFRSNDYFFDSNNHLNLEGVFFPGDIEFKRSDFENLELHKKTHLLNEYGRWDGAKYGILSWACG